jgi:hypothetical protein
VGSERGRVGSERGRVGSERGRVGSERGRVGTFARKDMKTFFEFGFGFPDQILKSGKAPCPVLSDNDPTLVYSN